MSDEADKGMKVLPSWREPYPPDKVLQVINAGLRSALAIDATTLVQDLGPTSLLQLEVDEKVFQDGVVDLEVRWSVWARETLYAALPTRMAGLMRDNVAKIEAGGTHPVLLRVRRPPNPEGDFIGLGGVDWVLPRVSGRNA